MGTPNSLLEHALQYRKQGYSVIPLGEGSKIPAIDWGPYILEAATTGQIERWWTKKPAANIGLVTGHVSGIVAVDVDPGADPEVIHRDYPTAMIASTPRGGFHLFYKYTNGAVIQSRTRVRPNVDVRGDGGYVVAAPSVVGGKAYRWESRGLPSEAFPPWISRPVGPGPSDESHGEPTQKDQGWLTRLLDGVGEGERNQSLTRITGYFAKKQIPEDVAGTIMTLWNAKLSQPLPLAEVSRSVRSVYEGDRSRAVRQPGGDAGPWAVPLNVYADKYSWASQDWYVDDWLPDQTCALVVSPPGTFKTWLLTDLAVATASGTPFLGQFPTRKGSVLFIQQEDPHPEILARIACCYNSRVSDAPTPDGVFEINRMPRELPIFVHPHRQLSLEDPKSVDDLREAVRDIRPRLVVIDPLYSTAGTDDFMAKAAGRMLAYKELRDEIGCSFVIAHHTKKSAESTDRMGGWGSQFLNAWLETGWQIRPGADSSAVVRRHFKVSESQAEIGLRFDIGDSFNVEVVAVEEARAQGAGELTDDIMLMLSTHGPQTANEIGAKMGKKPFSIRRRLQKLEEKGMVNKEGSKWSQI